MNSIEEFVKEFSIWEEIVDIFCRGGSVNDNLDLFFPSKLFVREKPIDFPHLVFKHKDEFYNFIKRDIPVACKYIPEDKEEYFDVDRYCNAASRFLEKSEEWFRTNPEDSLFKYKKPIPEEELKKQPCITLTREQVDQADKWWDKHSKKHKKDDRARCSYNIEWTNVGYLCDCKCSVCNESIYLGEV